MRMGIMMNRGIMMISFVAIRVMEMGTMMIMMMIIIMMGIVLAEQTDHANLCPTEIRSTMRTTA
jgi:hypothetical protein